MITVSVTIILIVMVSRGIDCNWLYCRCTRRHDEGTLRRVLHQPAEGDPAPDEPPSIQPSRQRPRGVCVCVCVCVCELSSFRTFHSCKIKNTQKNIIYVFGNSVLRVKVYSSGVYLLLSRLKIVLSSTRKMSVQFVADASVHHPTKLFIRFKNITPLIPLVVTRSVLYYFLYMGQTSLVTN